ncbi:MAG TPA: dTMP kinase [Sutterella sp.]|nr:dTMP kinase [Sutterella sp.]
MSKPRFITFEGIDGAGKTTQIRAVTQTAAEKGIDFILTREPGGTPAGEIIRKTLLNEAMDPLTETLLFFASRAELVQNVIRPALEAGRWVFCDRFTDATYAYQSGAKGIPAETVLTLEKTVLGDFKPDLTILFDIAPEIAATRLSKAREADRFERESIDFFTRVRNAYLERAKADPDRFFIIDSSRAPEVITQELKEFLRSWL